MVRFEADVDRVTEFRQQRLSWTEIQTLLVCSKKAMTKWRARVFFVDPFPDVDDEELDQLVTSIVEDQPLIGQVTIDSILHGVLGVVVTRERVRASIARVDPDGVKIRRDALGKRIVRRVYRIGGPDRLWHTDGMHKLIRHGIIVHACIDGFSRFITWCKLSFNNRAATQLAYLKEATATLGTYPSRLRGDCGVENGLMAQEMIRVRGTDRGSFIYGKSTSNVRIERHWRDLRKNVRRYLFV